MNRYFVSMAFILVSSGADAHESVSQLQNWNNDPFTIISLTLLAFGYVLGFRNRKRSIKEGPSSRSREGIFFSLALAILIIALITPLDRWSDELQAWHMIQHMLIIVFAAPFFVMAAPLDIFLWALPARTRRKLGPLYKWLYGYKSGWYFLWHPCLLWALFAITLWIWHLPRFYNAALISPRIHDLQHISFFLSSCLFWRLLLDPLHRFRIERTMGIMYLFTATLHATLLGVFMALSPRTWYSFYESTSGQWGLSALEDQQIAGLIMWMPACMAYVFVTGFIFLRWTEESKEKRSA